MVDVLFQSAIYPDPNAIGVSDRASERERAPLAGNVPDEAVTGPGEPHMLSGAGSGWAIVSNASNAAFNGNQFLHYFDLWYGYIHYTLSTIDFGVISEDQTILMTIWNANVDTIVAVTSNLPSDPSLTVTEPDTPPFNILRLEELTYQFDVTKDGDAEVDDRIILNFDVEPSRTIPIVGIRILPFEWEPNWQEPIEQVFSWNTEIIQGTGGEEQRIKKMSVPRMAMTYTMLSKGDRTRLLYNRLLSWRDKLFALPMWMNCLEVASQALSGTTQIEIADSTGTFTDISTLLYVPALGRVLRVASVAVADHAQARETVFVTTPFGSQTETFDILLTGARYCRVTFSGTQGTNNTWELRGPAGDVLSSKTVNGEVFDETFYIAGDRVQLYINNSGSGHGSDINITLHDLRQSATLTMNQALPATLEAGSKVYPCLSSYLTEFGEFHSHTDDVKEVEVSFLTVPMVGAETFDINSLYKGSIVENREPEMSDGIGHDVDASFYITDYGLGPIFAGIKNEWVGAMLKRDEVLDGGPDIRTFLGAEFAKFGRLVSFWQPTFTTDFRVVDPVIAAQNTMNVDAADHAILFSQSTEYRDIRILLSDNSLIHRGISNVVDNGDGTETITLDANWGQDIEVAEFKKISYMILVRNRTDAMVLTWETDRMAKVSRVLQSVIT